MISDQEIPTINFSHGFYMVISQNLWWLLQEPVSDLTGTKWAAPIGPEKVNGLFWEHPATTAT